MYFLFIVEYGANEQMYHRNPFLTSDQTTPSPSWGMDLSSNLTYSVKNTYLHRFSVRLRSSRPIHIEAWLSHGNVCSLFIYLLRLK